MQPRIRPIAIHLPQFHPIPENDAWWGKGFTEWTNVAKAKPRFKNHYQPHLPADLGFYDLRLPEIMESQALMAREFGIYGFCFYHYWFNGKRLLNTPVDEMVKSRRVDFPFIVCWANENWTRRWDGKDSEVLMAQHYSNQDHIDHIRFLCDNFFSDDRYIRIDNKPVFLVYRTELIPDIEKCSELWRREARLRGLKDLYLIRVESFMSDKKPADLGFDAAMEFQPNWKKLPKREKPSLPERVLHFTGLYESHLMADKVFDYSKMASLALSQKESEYKLYKCITPMWDNSARREKKATIFINSTPETYGNWFRETIKRFKPYSEEENFIFLNAWNEWAEGNHLEPCSRWGKRYLEETRDSIITANLQA